MKLYYVMKKTIIWIVAAIAVAVAGYFFVKNGTIKEMADNFGGNIGTTTSGIGDSGSGGNIPSVSGISASKEEGEAVAQAAADFESAPLDQTYENSDYGFSVKYPSGLTQTDIAADESAGTPPMILFTDSASGLGFQVIVSDFREDNANITPDRIRQDISDQVITDPQPVDLGSLGKGTTFLDGPATDPNTNRQIWFAANNHLFQITSEPVFDKTMQKILATWTFK